MITTASLLWNRAATSNEAALARRLMLVWGLLFFNVLGSPPGGLLHLPHKAAQALTQGALVAAFVLAVTVNRRILVRPNWFLGLYTLLGALSLMMSVRLVGLGPAYRSFRLLGFLAVLWLLTPWWSDRRMLLVRAHVLALLVTLGTVVVGIVISPRNAFSINFGTVRLRDIIWSIPTTRVAHLMAILVGLLVLALLSGDVRRKPALVVIFLGVAAIVATHTRTALVGLAFGLLVACLSLFFRKRRVRRGFAVLLIVVMAALPFTPLIKNWLIRGENSSALLSLSGRTKVWPLVLTEARPETNKLFGSGMTNDSLINQNPAVDGLPIDSAWFATYQNQGLVGCILEAILFALLLLLALLRPRGPTSAMALFLVVYCFVDSFTQTGMGEASIVLLDLVLAASLLVPRSAKLETPETLEAYDVA